MIAQAAGHPTPNHTFPVHQFQADKDKGHAAIAVKAEIGCEGRTDIEQMFRNAVGRRSVADSPRLRAAWGLHDTKSESRG